MYIIFKEVVNDAGQLETQFLFPYVDHAYNLHVKDLVATMNELIPEMYKTRMEVRYKEVPGYDVNFTERGENIFIVARLRKGVIEEILDAYPNDLTFGVDLLNKENKDENVKYIGAWLKGNLC